MISDQLHAYSAESPSEALSEALGHAIHESAGAANTHVIVQKILATGAGWKAVLNYVLEPRAAEDPQSKKTHISHQRKTLGLPQSPHDEDDREGIEHEHHEHYMHKMLEEQIYSEIRQKELAGLGLNLETNFIHLYIKDSDEAVFRAIEDRFSFDSVHVLSGPLWNEANRRHPDLEMYEAAHNLSTTKQTKDPDTNQKKPAYRDELIDKLKY